MITIALAVGVVTLLALSVLHPYALVFTLTGTLIGVAAVGPGRLWIAAVLVPIATTWLFLVAVAERLRVRRFIPLQVASVLFGLMLLAWTALLWMTHKQPRFLAAALIAVTIQGALAWYVARVASHYPGLGHSRQRVVFAVLGVSHRQARWPLVARFRYRGCGRVSERFGYLESALVCEALHFDGDEAAPLAAYIARFPGEAHGQSIGDCFHPSSSDRNDRMLRPPRSSDDGLTLKLHRRAVITFAEFGHSRLIPRFLYALSAVSPPAVLSLPEARIVAYWLTLAPGSTLQLTVPANRVVSTEPPFRSSTTRSARERLDLDVGYPRPLRIGMIDHLFMVSGGVQLTFAKLAFASPRWIAFLRFLASPTGRWLLLVACAVLTPFLLRSRP
jgi:hypothetical protein